MHILSVLTYLQDKQLQHRGHHFERTASEQSLIQNLNKKSKKKKQKSESEVLIRNINLNSKSLIGNL